MIEELVFKEIADNPLANRRIGMKEIWESTEQDIIEQQALNSSATQAKEFIKFIMNA